MTNVYSGQRSYGRFSPEARRRNDFENRDSMNDMDRQRDSSMTETKPKEKMNESQEAVMTCKAYDRVRCGLCFKWPAHKCNAMTSSEIELKCGCIVSVIADACCSGRENMPVREGMMNGKSVTVLRDTGCSTVVVRRSLVKNDQYTGREEICYLIDGTVRRTPVVEVQVDTPFYKGQVTAVCMDNPLHDVVTGNVANAIDDVKEKSYETLAVITRAQTKQQDKTQKPLKVIGDLGDDITKGKLIGMQQQDVSLRKCMKEAERDEEDGKSDIYLGIVQVLSKL